MGEDAGATLAIFGSQPRYDVIHTGMDWSEGALFLPDGSIICPDVPRNHILRWRPGRKRAKVWIRNSGSAPDDYSSEPGSNGLALDAEGRLLACQHGARRIARYNGRTGLPPASWTPVADGYHGKRFNSPNDLVVATDGSILFTDPIYGLPGREKSMDRDLDYCGVFRVGPLGKVELLIDSLERPNGIALSPDGRTLYISNSYAPRAVVMAYPVLNAGYDLGPGRIFLDAREQAATGAGSCDGMAVSRTGLVFATGPGGVWVVRPDGRLLAKIRTGTRVSNVALSPDEEYLCLTSDYYLLRVRLLNLSE